MSKLETIIINIQKDLSNEIIDKDTYLAQCALERINERNRTYEMQFDKFLNSISKSEMNRDDLVRVSDTLRRLSKLVTSTYDGLIKMISCYEKNIFHKST